MEKIIALAVAFAVAMPLLANAATPSNQANSNFSQGRHAEQGATGPATADFAGGQ